MTILANRANIKFPGNAPWALLCRIYLGHPEVLGASLTMCGVQGPLGDAVEGRGAPWEWGSGNQNVVGCMLGMYPNCSPVS